MGDSKTGTSKQHFDPYSVFCFVNNVSFSNCQRKNGEGMNVKSPKKKGRKNKIKFSFFSYDFCDGFTALRGAVVLQKSW